MTVRLDRRLKTVLGMVRVQGRIADVGTDHALLPCRLFQLGAADIIATDIADGPLERAGAAVKFYGAESAVRLVKCDGLDEVPIRDDVIIAGMGGEMTADIIARCKFLNPDLHFILQPMTRDFVLRKRLYELGCEIIKEETAVVARKVYTVMLCRYTGVKQETDLRFQFLGKNNDREYLEKQITTLHKMGKSRSECETLAAELEKETAWEE